MQTHRSPGISQVLTEIGELEKPNVLDLGATCTDMLAYFSGKCCKLYFEDLPALLLNSELGDQAVEAQAEQYMLDYSGTQFDLVLGWDLLNYLELPTINKLMAKINQHCRPNTLFHIIRYTGQHIPIQPRRFKLAADGLLSFEDTPRRQRVIECHNTVRLLHYMTDQFMEDTLMNEQGMQSGFVEHILRYKPTEHQHRVNTTGRGRVRSQVPPQQSTDKITEKNGSADSENLSAVEHTNYSAPGIQQIVHYLARLEQPKVLVFSSRQGRQFDDLLTVARDVYVEDIFNSLLWQKSKPGATCETENHQYFRYSLETKFDAIFAWDLFNYCQPKEISAIGQLLAQHCTDKSRLHLLSYTHSDIPARPCQFSLTEQIQVAVPRQSKISCRRHNLTAAGLIKLLPNFYVNATHAFQTGMISGACEYVFEYRQASRPVLGPAELMPTG